ncbi:MAG TPA: phosphate ABC transporter permease PtsA [Ruminiclostridium sp.]|nr:phosphate ABC transporter permease PstA [Clostridiaceae bacterium]HAA25321.1 phosphate ABC transporter permease PtsA [Ruminiclostridium sp.]
MPYWRKYRDYTIKTIVWIFALAALGFLFWILSDLVVKGLPNITLDFITGEYNEYKGINGIAPMIVTTIWIISVTLIVSGLIGVFAAIYLAEYSRPGPIVRFIRFALDNLAGIPSIIYGLFGYVFFKNMMKLGFSILSASLTLTIMVLPFIIGSTENALREVNRLYRDGSLALGATKLHTVMNIILPCAAPRIITTMLLTVGRIAGETAAVYFTAGTVYRYPEGIMSSGRTLSVHIYMLAKETGRRGETYASALLLVIFISLIHFIVNAALWAINAKRI